MTDRGMAHSDGAPACPFVAFEDDRDERSDRPDHRHRCYAEVHPAPRAIAHQEAYCLSSAFAVCPTFQDWAHREAARTRGDGVATVPPPAVPIAASAAAGRPDAEPGRPAEPHAGDGDWAEPAAEWQGRRPEAQDDGPAPLPPRRNPPRDWAAPPPWASGAGAAGAGAGAGAAGSAGGAPGAAAAGGAGGQSAPYGGDPEARGLAGSSADRVASGDSFVPDEGQTSPPRPPSPPEVADQKDVWQPSRSPERAQPADAELAGLVGPRVATSPPVQESHPSYPDNTGAYEGPPGAASGASRHDTRHGPSWEEPRRYEAYPTIKTRATMPGLPRLGVMAAALGIAALALFFLPSLLDLFGGSGSGGTAGDASPSPSAAIESAAPSPTVAPAPTPQIYVVKSGDTMSKIAKRFDVSIDDLIEANKDTIKDPDKISIGDEVIIPVPPAEDPGGFLEESPSP